DPGAGGGDLLEAVAAPDARHQLEVLGGVDRSAGLGAHTAAGADHGDGDRAGCILITAGHDGLRSPLGMMDRVTSGGEPLPQVSGPTSTRVEKAAASRAARARTSSAPTRALRPRVSSTLQ